MKSVNGYTFLIKTGILLPAVAWMVSGLFAPIQGNFYFRQAHVAANVEKYLEQGLSMKPATYNLDIPYAIFDFPAYQLLAAALSTLLQSDPLVICRLLSILSFALSFIIIGRLLARTSIPIEQSLFVLLFFTYSPLNLFFFQTPIVDGFAILFSLLSLYAMVRWDQSSVSRERWRFWLLMVAGGILATLIKNPVYLPFFLGVLCFALGKFQWRALIRPGIFAYVLVIGGAVIAFKLYANEVNGIAGFFDDTEAGDYFGPWMDRLDLQSWRRILQVLATQTLTVVTLLLSFLGVALYGKDRTQKYKSLYTGLWLGAIIALLVFFNRYTWHNYYQLPMVFPFAFFAGYGAFRLKSLVGSQIMSRAFVAAVVVFTLGWNLARLPELTGTPTEWLDLNGRWIEQNTNPGDFVVYVLDTRDPTDWNPAFLYFAKRDGYNLPKRRVRPRLLANIYRRLAVDYERFLVFCPAALTETHSQLIEESGGVLIEAGPRGMLYRLSRL